MKVYDGNSYLIEDIQKLMLAFLTKKLELEATVNNTNKMIKSSELKWAETINKLKSM